MDLKEESETSVGKIENEASVETKFDPNGHPLIPQPSVYSDDPLNWTPSRKLLVTLQVAWIAFIGNFSSAVANPAFSRLGKWYGITTVEASYLLTAYIWCVGFGPFLIIPLSNIYGRRPVYLMGTLVSAIANIAGGYSPKWAGILATRAIIGIAAGSAGAIGSASIVDMYFMHERGFYMGLYTVALTNGPHLAALVGGFVAQHLEVLYCFRIPGFMQLGTFIVIAFCLPETLYSRLVTEHEPRSFVDLLLFRAARPKRTLQLRDFWRQLYMLKYLSITIPGIYYSVAFGFGSVLFATTGSQLFGQLYHFNTAQTGLLLSLPLLIGGLIGEASTGWVIDWFVRHDAKRRPEVRLNALWLGLTIPAGIILDGRYLQLHKVPHAWVGAAMGMGLANFGLQAITTVIYSYTTDCYKAQAAEVSVLLNLFRSLFSACIAFFAIKSVERLGVLNAWIVFAFINLALFVPTLLLRFFGTRLRATPWQAPPNFHTDL